MPVRALELFTAATTRIAMVPEPRGPAWGGRSRARSSLHLESATIPAGPRSRAARVPERVGRYVLEAHLGDGGMGSVYRARRDDGRAVALKLLHCERLTASFGRRFAREVEAMSAVRHPNVVRLESHGVFEGRPWLAMELVEGPDLAAWVAAEGPQPAERVVAILRQLADALAAVHAEGLVHRDVKPSNIALAGGDRIKLLDFGLAVRPGRDEERLTAPDSLLGTPGYLPPEGLSGGPHALDARSDLYALALTALFLRIGRNVLKPVDVLCEDAFRVALERGLAEVEARGGLPAPVGALLACCLRFDRRERPRCAARLAVALASSSGPAR